MLLASAVRSYVEFSVVGICICDQLLLTLDYHRFLLAVDLYQNTFKYKTQIPQHL